MTDAKKTTMLRELWQEAFGDDDKFLDLFFSTAFSEERCETIEICDKIAAALYWFECNLENKKIAYIYAVATAKDHRNKGLCRQLFDKTHTRLTVLGFSGAILVPSSEKLFNFYSKLGYSKNGYINEFSASASNRTVQLEKIDKNEYALLRRTFLPKNGIIQEKENLDFLAAQYYFYKGDNLLLAAKLSKKRLYCPELLGDTLKAGDILNTLKCESGFFRTVGNEKAFTMYKSFTSNPPPSVHFAFAFD